MILVKLFIILQSILLLFMLLHDWVKVPPFNDIDALRKADSFNKIIFSTIINSLFVATPLFLTFRYFFTQPIPSIILLINLGFYIILTIGTICAWWIPYIFGSSAQHKQHLKKFKNTHHFLPSHGDNIIPNSLHVALHLLVWSCCALSIYFYIH